MKRLVIKVGTAVLTQGEELAYERMKNLVKLISILKKEKNIDVILVSSGAVGAGYTSLKLFWKILAINGVHATVSGTSAAVSPIDVPTMNLVNGMMEIIKIINGNERIVFTRKSKIRLITTF